MFRPYSLDEKLAAVLPAGSLYAVGGRVRDEIRSELLGESLPIKDLDYVVAGVQFEALRGALSQLGRVDVVGAAFAVIKLTLDGQTVDVGMPRRERSTGHGHREFEVQSGPEIPLADDLSRRDFRMNMIARALPGGELVDPYGGAKPTSAPAGSIFSPRRRSKKTRCACCAAAQFAARFEYELTPKTRAAMTHSAALVATVSPERVADELTKLLVRAQRPSIGLELLRETGILAYIWPELLEGVGVDQNEWHAYDVWCHNLVTLDAAAPGDLINRLAALLHDVGKPRTKDGPHFYRHEIVGAEMVRSMLERFRFSNEVVDTTERLVRQHMYVADPDMKDATLRRFIRRIGPASLERQFALRMADVAGSGLPKRDDGNERFAVRVHEEVARAPAFSVADLHVGGEDVVAALVRRGTAEPGFQR